tara:strand:- start:674 stop:3073 length:2400 start_codon:yes stop_codon:yes gene_type:complete
MLRPIIPNQQEQLDNSLEKYSAVQQIIENKSKKPNDSTIPVCYGYTMTEGIKLFETIGQTNNILEQVYVLSEGPIEGLTGININGYGLDLKAIALSNGDSYIGHQTIYTIPKTTNNQQNLPFNGAFEFEFINGADYSSVILNANTNLKERVLFGNIAAVVVRLIKTSNNTIWEDDGDPTISFELLGKKIPPIGNSSGTLAYSNNPARIMYDYLTNGIYGKGLADSYLDSTSFSAAETYFATTANIVRFEPDMAQFQFDGQVDTNQPFYQNLEAMLQNFLCSLPYVNTKFFLNVERPIVNDPSDIAYDFTDDNVIGNVGIAYSGTKDKWNNLLLEIRDRNAYYSTQTYAFPDATAGTYSVYVTQDGQQRLENTINLPYTEMAHMALNIGQIMTQKARDKFNVTWSAKADAYQVRVGDLVEITNSRVGLSSQRIRVTKTTFDVKNLTVNFEGFKHDDAYYTYDTGRLKFIYPQTKRPNLPGPTPPAERPPVFEPPTVTLPDPEQPGGPGTTPPDSGMPTPGETFTYTFAGSPATMADNDRYYLGEFDYTDESTGSRTERFDSTGSQCHMSSFQGAFVSQDKFSNNQLLSGLTTQLSIFDRNFVPGETEELFFVLEYQSGKYGFSSQNTSIGRTTFDPQTDGAFYTKTNSDGSLSQPLEVLQSSYFIRLRLWPDGRGNYSTRFSPSRGLYPASNGAANGAANMPFFIPKLGPNLSFDPFGITGGAEMATILNTEGTIGIKVWKKGIRSQPNYVGEFDANFRMTNIASQEVVAESRKQYRFMISGGPSIPRGTPNDTTISVPF